MEEHPEEGEHDAIALGAAEPPDDVEESAADPGVHGPRPLAAVEGPADEPIPEVQPDLVAAVDEVGRAFDPPDVVAAAEEVCRGSSSASTDPPPPPPFPACGYLISDLGYVTFNRPGHDPTKPIGLVGWKRDGKSIFANCHLHPVCSISAGIQRVHIPREHMAEWLCTGQKQPPGLSREARLAMGAEHRRNYVRP